MTDITLTYYSDVKNSRLQKSVSEKIAQELAHFNGKRVEIKIQRLKSTRSIQQNRLYWLYVTMIADELGYNKNEMAEIIKYKFLKKSKIDETTGEEFEYVGSTTKLNKTEFADMVNSIIQWSAETFNIVLPAPNEQTEVPFNS